MQNHNPFLRQPEPDTDQRLLTPAQASKTLQLCERTLYNLVKTGQLKRIKIGKAVRFDVNDLEEFTRLQIM